MKLMRLRIIGSISSRKGNHSVSKSKTSLNYKLFNSCTFTLWTESIVLERQLSGKLRMR